MASSITQATQPYGAPMTAAPMAGGPRAQEPARVDLAVTSRCWSIAQGAIAKGLGMAPSRVMQPDECLAPGVPTTWYHRPPSFRIRTPSTASPTPNDSETGVDACDPASVISKLTVEELTGPWSLGSVGHPFACSEACKYIGKTRGCKDGKACLRCHRCKWSSKKQNKADLASPKADLASPPAQSGSPHGVLSLATALRIDGV